MAFQKATRSQQKLRLAISGVSGGGKTYTMLELAKHLGKRTAVIDTERGSASLYAGKFDFQTDHLTHYSADRYIGAIKEAAQEGFDVLGIDSLSHAWAGKGGILEEADNRGGKFQAWKELTPIQQQLIDTILDYPGHVICTMRSKMTYEVSSDDSGGRKSTKVEKLGLAPVQREGLEYEFTLWMDMDIRNIGRISKSRCDLVPMGSTWPKPGKELADALMLWLAEGSPALLPGRDEYGLIKPKSECPIFSPRAAVALQGKRWDDFTTTWQLEKWWADESIRAQFNTAQTEWAPYMIERRARRKAAEEARAAEEAARVLAAQQQDMAAEEAARDPGSDDFDADDVAALAAEAEEAERALAARDGREVGHG